MVILFGLLLFSSCGSDGDYGDDSNPLNSNGDTNGGGDESYTVSGKVADSSGAGIYNVEIELTSESGQKQTTKDSNRNYPFSSVVNGTYIMSVVHTEYTFRESEVEVTVDIANEIVSNIRGEKNE